MIQVEHFKGRFYDVITYNSEYVYYADPDTSNFWKRRINQFLGEHHKSDFEYRFRVVKAYPFSELPKSKELFPYDWREYLDVTDYDYSLFTPNVTAHKLNLELVAALVEFVEVSDDE